MVKLSGAGHGGSKAGGLWSETYDKIVIEHIFTECDW